MREKAGAVVCMIGLSSAAAVGDTIHVPGDQPTIAAAIAAAGDGDEIIVAPGVYYEWLDTRGKQIELRSADGPKNTIIDAQSIGRAILCRSGEGPGTLIEGFTIRAGYGLNGGGMEIRNASPTVRGCAFIDNLSIEVGGAVAVIGGNPTIQECTFHLNRVVFPELAGGGAVGVLDGAATLTDCLFHANAAFTGEIDGRGGGLFACDSDLLVSGCTFQGNYAHRKGGGLAVRRGTLRVESSTFDHNVAGLEMTVAGGEEPGRGGGAFVQDTTDAVFVNCIFTDNVAAQQGEGGGIQAFQADLLVANTVFDGNVAGTGAGVGGLAFTVDAQWSLANCLFLDHAGTSLHALTGFNGTADLVVTNCTFSASEVGVALTTLDDPSTNLVVANSILWGNSVQIDADQAASAAVHRSNVQGGWAGEGADNIDLDPMWADAPAGDLRLAPGSPCIDAGDNTLVPADFADVDGDLQVVEKLPLDLDLAPRFVDDPASRDTGVPGRRSAVCDLGAYEYQPTRSR